MNIFLKGNPKLFNKTLLSLFISKICSTLFRKMMLLDSMFLFPRNLPSLEKLYLDDNLIKELDEKSFLNLLSLKELRLEYNLIKTINERAFYRIPSIR